MPTYLDEQGNEIKNRPSAPLDQFDTKLTPEQETKFQAWKAKYAPRDSGADYDLRGAFLSGFKPDPETGHWKDTFKKPNHPTFSDESKYAAFGNPGHWTGPNHDIYVSGNKAATGKTYLDENGNEVKAGPAAREQLQAAHAKNVAAGEAAYKPSWTEAYQQGAQTGGGPGGFLSVMQQMAKDVPAAIAETPQRLAGMAGGLVKGAGELVNPENYKSIAENPIVDLPGKVGAGIIQGTTEPLISPRTTGKALTEAAVDTALLSGAGKAVSYGAKTVAPAASRRIVQSILKPAEGDLKFGKEPVNAFLEEKFTGSLPKIRADVAARKGQYLKDVQNTLAQSTETTPRSQILDILENEKGRIAGEVGTVNDKALNRGIDTIKRKIEANYPEELSQTDLHKLRKEIDSSIPKFTSEAVEQGLNNVRYNLRSGINEIMEAKSPGIAQANARVSELIDIDRMLGNRVRQASNAPLPGLGRGTTLTDLALGIPRATLGSPAVLTRAANVLNTFAPKTGLAGAIGSIGAAPVVAPRKPGLAGALERTQPAPAFKGDIKPAVQPSMSQAATQLAPAPIAGGSGPAATVVSQPPGGLGGALDLELESLPRLPGGSLDLADPRVYEYFEKLTNQQRRPRSALESTPTLVGSRSGGY